MKNLTNIFLVPLIMLIACNSVPQTKKIKNQAFDFRKSTWGMSKDDVIETENRNNMVASDTNILVFSGSIGNAKALVSYLFSSNKLTGGGYLVAEKYTSSNTYILKFDELKKDLISKYGKPESDSQNWIDDFYKNTPNNYGMAVSKGELVYNTIWRLKDKSILLELKGEGYKSELNISYFSSVSMKKYKKAVPEGL